jgi:hypothetical protein
MDDKQFDKLPLYARREMTMLRNRVSYLEERAASGPEDSDTFAYPYSDAPIPLGEGTGIQFGTDRLGAFIVRLMHDGTLDVHSGDLISILPRAANSARIQRHPR